LSKLILDNEQGIISNEDGFVQVRRLQVAEELDLAEIEAQNLNLEKLDSDPAPRESGVYYNTVSKTIRVSDGTNWSDASGGGSPGGTHFSGDLVDSTQGYLSNSTSGQPVTVRDNHGLSVANEDGVEGKLTLSVRQTTNPTFPIRELAIYNSGTIFLPSLVDGDAHGYSGQILGVGVDGTNVGKLFHARFSFTIAQFAGTTRIVNDSGEYITRDIPAWDISVEADLVNHRPAVYVTGDSGSTISWRGYFDIVKVR
jgi:hypothetical protein